jgi:hypothetical protein
MFCPVSNISFLENIFSKQLHFFLEEGAQGSTVKKYEIMGLLMMNDERRLLEWSKILQHPSSY